MSRFSQFHGRFPRAPWHDQRQGGWYFITIKTDGRLPLFARIRGNRLELTPFGRIVEEEWRRTSTIRAEVNLGPFVVMPDHFHALVGVCLSTGRPNAERSAPSGFLRHPKSIGALVGGFKGACTKRINELRRTPGKSVWQSNYHDLIVQSHRRWLVYARYIEQNPEKLIQKTKLIP